jgi:hypothetical protein
LTVAIDLVALNSRHSLRHDFSKTREECHDEYQHRDHSDKVQPSCGKSSHLMDVDVAKERCNANRTGGYG